jgi:hypothetical protein
MLVGISFKIRTGQALNKGTKFCPDYFLPAGNFLALRMVYVSGTKWWAVPSKTMMDRLTSHLYQGLKALTLVDRSPLVPTANSGLSAFLLDRPQASRETGKAAQVFLTLAPFYQ